jgi:cell division protein FtsB
MTQVTDAIFSQQQTSDTALRAANDTLRAENMDLRSEMATLRAQNAALRDAILDARYLLSEYPEKLIDNLRRVIGPERLKADGVTLEGNKKQWAALRPRL